MLQDLADQDPGSWVLLGGALVLAVGAGSRVTYDIDLARSDTKDLITPFGLVSIAEKYGLPIETLNQAVSVFLHRLDFENKLVSLFSGKCATVYRPNFELFFELKMARCSQSDAEDILAYAEKFPDEVDKKKLGEFFEKVPHSKGTIAWLKARLLT